MDELIRCRHCRYFDADEKRCRRYAPRPIAGEADAVWPTVDPNDACGEGRKIAAMTDELATLADIYATTVRELDALERIAARKADR